VVGLSYIHINSLPCTFTGESESCVSARLSIFSGRILDAVRFIFSSYAFEINLSAVPPAVRLGGLSSRLRLVVAGLLEISSNSGTSTFQGHAKIFKHCR
jgi:hypothetical protein